MRVVALHVIVESPAALLIIPINMVNHVFNKVKHVFNMSLDKIILPSMHNERRRFNFNRAPPAPIRL